MSDQNQNIGTGWPKDAKPKEPVNENQSAQRATTESESHPMNAATSADISTPDRGLFVEDVRLEEPVPVATIQAAQVPSGGLFVEDIRLEEPEPAATSELEEPEPAATSELGEVTAAVEEGQGAGLFAENVQLEEPPVTVDASEDASATQSPTPVEAELPAAEVAGEQLAASVASQALGEAAKVDLGSTQAFAAFTAAELAEAAAAKAAEADRLRAEADEVAAAARAKAAEEEAAANAAQQAAAAALAEEEERLRVEDEEMRERERQARDRKLGVVPVNTEAVPVPTRPETPVTYKFWGALGLFILRLVTAAVVGVRGIQVVTDIPGTIDGLVALNAPYAGPLAWVLGCTLLVAAIMLVFGFGTRVAGIVLALLGVLVLTFVRWGAFNIFLEGQNGFMGDFDLLLVGVGLLLATLGGGGWGIDGGIYRGRLRRKYGA